MASLDHTLKRIRAKGFEYIKIELEGQLHRDTCMICMSNGWHAHDICNGTGIAGESECSCEDGNIPCEFTSYSVDKCEEFIEEYVSDRADTLKTYGSFYNDGSVDSEYTVTLPLSVDGLNAGIEYIEAFKALAREIGHPIITAGAGMHIALLNSEYGTYPSGNRLDQERLKNFKTQVTKLLPALFFLGTSNAKTRGTNYRHMRVSSNKYSAINCGNGVLEYRVFDTCYDRPKALLDYVEVIANTLKYYSNQQLHLNRSIRFIVPEGQHLARLFTSPAQLKWLNQTLKYLKPTDKTIAQLKHERNFKLDHSKLRKLAKKQQFQCASEWQEYRDRLKKLKKLEKEALIESYQLELGVLPSDEWLTNRIKSGFSGLPNTLKGYITRKLSTQRVEESTTI